MTELPLIHPDRRAARLDLPKAWHYLQRLKRNKEKTSEIFHVFEALPWFGCTKAACAFLQTPRGRQLYAQEPYLPDILDDHAALRRYPPGTFAHDYCDYMESEGLSAAGLVAEYEDWRGGRPRLDDQVEWYVDRLRDTHDLLHILTGFGRDALGEECVAGFVYHQRRSIGHIFLAYVGGMVLKRHVKGRAPVMRAVYEARQIGKHCSRICEESILELLAMPIEAVRARLGIRPAYYYHEVHRVWREEEGLQHNEVFAVG